jgi:hypothetical protein
MEEQMVGKYQKQRELDAAASAACQEAQRLEAAFSAARNAAPATRAAAREARDRSLIRSLTANRDAAAFRAALTAKVATVAEEALQGVLARQAKERATAEAAEAEGAES